MKSEISVDILLNCGSEYLKETIDKIKKKTIFWKDVLNALLKFEYITHSAVDTQKNLNTGLL